MREELTDIDQVRMTSDLNNAVVVRLDSSGGELGQQVKGALFLDCILPPGGRRRAAESGALVFPTIPGLPYAMDRSRLYTPTELFAGFDPTHPSTYADTSDARIYRHSQEQGSDPIPSHDLAQRLHAHYIAEALTAALADPATSAPVAVMGGHSVPRDSRGYRRAVQLGARLGTAEFSVITGGGPGVMEAVALGVRGGEDTAVLRDMARVPQFGDDAESIGRWIAACPSDLPTSDTAPCPADVRPHDGSLSPTMSTRLSNSCVHIALSRQPRAVGQVGQRGQSPGIVRGHCAAV
ncbi:hypothetical protein [Nocardia beijingensis]|uniref:SLOG cluster 4 domain-containing protein n=1 Tax=Nocardia beijingensis TaxID=95162 RepID=UPI001E4E1A7B|nr:hypothetical protein [Nocardia beijingensis]